MVSPGKSIEGTRAEVRCPDPSSNTYLAFAAMIAAGLDGVEKGLPAGRAGRGVAVRDGRRDDRREGHPRAARARSARRSTSSRRDTVIREALGDHVFSHYVEAKRAEWDEYRTQVSDWEVERYLDAVLGLFARAAASTHARRAIIPTRFVELASIAARAVAAHKHAGWASTTADCRVSAR